MGSIAVVALAVALAPTADAKPKPDLSVTGVEGVPSAALTGDELPLKVRIANDGKAASKDFKVTARLAPETGSPVPPVIGAEKAGPLAPNRSTTAKPKVTIPRWAVGRWKLVVCVPPGKGRNDCRTSAAVEIDDGSSWALIEAARAAGDLDPGEADLYGLYALTGDPRLPSSYGGNGEAHGDETFRAIAADWPSLSQAERDALWPYFLQPGYAQSAWAPPGAKRAGSAAARSAKGTVPPACGSLDRVQGAFNGIETAHAWFWYRPGSGSSRSRAQALAGEFEQKVWPKLTAAFKAVDDSAGAACDPAGDSKIDIYLNSALVQSIRPGSGGVAPRVPLGDSCGPSPSFVVLPENANRWALAHEFMHVIEWAYRACDRHPTWVEGIATWAGDFVYKGDQDEHGYPKGILFAYSSLLSEDAGNYESWPFWYSVAKQGGAAAIKQYIEALAGGDARQAFAALPGGLRSTWKRYAVETWNAAPIGSSGFPVNKAFKQWDSFAQTPAPGEPVTKVMLGGLAEHTFDLKTYGPGGLGNPSGDLAPLSTSYTRATIDDENVRELRFRNALSGVPGPVVQAFLKLKSGRWRLEDWTDQSEVTLCRDEAAENVTELIVATSNALATGGPFGRATHELRARDSCTQAPIQGIIGGTESYTSDDGEVTMDYSFTGTVTFERNGSIDPRGYFGGTYPNEVWARYDVTDGTITYSGSGTSFGCTVELPSQTAPLSDIGLLALEPGPEPRYGIRDVSTQDFGQATFRCPPDNEPFPGSFLPPAGIYTPDPRQTMQRGIYIGSSMLNDPNVTASYTWNLSQAED
jgi:hypothetical protein